MVSLLFAVGSHQVNGYRMTLFMYMFVHVKVVFSCHGLPRSVKSACGSMFFGHGGRTVLRAIGRAKRCRFSVLGVEDCKLRVSAVRCRAGELSAKRGSSVGKNGAFGAEGGRSRWGRAEGKSLSEMSGKVAERCVETADAGSLHSRRRVSTTVSEDPLLIVRLPE